MQDPNEKIEDVKVDETEEKTEELLQEAIDVNKKFDDQIEKDEEPGDEENAADEKAEDETEDETNEKAEDKTDDNADKVEEKVEEKAVEKEKDDPFDNSLLERALNAGLTLSEARGFSSAVDLENSLNIFEEHQSRKTEEKEEEEKPYDSGLSKEDFDPALVDAINKSGQKQFDENKKLRNENKELQAGLEELKKSGNDRTAEIDRQTNVENTKWLDEQFNSLGDDFKEVLGKGTIEDFAKGSAELENRTAVFNEMLAMAQGYKVTRQSVPIREALFKRAINNLHGDKVAQAAISTTKSKLTKQSKQALGRASGRGKTATGMDTAVQANRDFDKKIDETD